MQARGLSKVFENGKERIWKTFSRGKKLIIKNGSKGGIQN